MLGDDVGRLGRIVCQGASSAKAMWLSNRRTGRMQMGRSWLRSTISPEHAVAVDCLMRLRSEASTVEFGYKIQALAAHVLLGLNHRVVEVNHKGHPDIVGVKDGQEFRFEVEAEIIGQRHDRRLEHTYEGYQRALSIIHPEAEQKRRDGDWPDRGEGRIEVLSKAKCAVLPSSSVGEESLSPNHPDTSSRF